jgi:hypothetical protein
MLHDVQHLLLAELTVVSRKDAERSFRRRQRIADLRYGLHLVRPADFVMEIAVDAIGKVPPAGVHRSHANSNRGDRASGEEESDPGTF